MFTTLPLELFVCREVIEQYFFDNEPFHMQRHIFFTTVILCSSMIGMSHITTISILPHVLNFLYSCAGHLRPRCHARDHGWRIRDCPCVHLPCSVLHQALQPRCTVVLALQATFGGMCGLRHHRALHLALPCSREGVDTEWSSDNLCVARASTPPPTSPSWLHSLAARIFFALSLDKLFCKSARQPPHCTFRTLFLVGISRMDLHYTITCTPET